jgi:hypothetical protein
VVNAASRALWQQEVVLPAATAHAALLADLDDARFDA